MPSGTPGESSTTDWRSARKRSWTGRSHPSGWNRRRRPSRNSDREGNPMRLTGKTVLVTGAGTGMGLEAARQLTALGNRVIMVARNKARLETEAARLQDASPFACDISEESQVAGLVDYVRQYHPELDILLLNAGVTQDRKSTRLNSSHSQISY